MIILGISEEADAGVSLIQDGKIIFAINEERLSRVKLQAEFPHHALKAALAYLDTHHLTEQLQGIALASDIHIGVPKKTSFSRQILGLLSHLRLARFVLGTNTGVKITRFLYQKMQSKRLPSIHETLSHYHLEQLPLKVYDHHFCHACSAYFTSGYSDCLTITLDAAGDGYCSKVYECTDGKMQLLHAVPFFHSIGYYYTLVTQILGFTKGGQQGKVTGLAARGHPHKAISIFEQKIPYNPKKMIFDNHGKYYFFEKPSLTAMLKPFSREDASAAIQKHLENSVSAYVNDIFKRFKINHANLALAGGVFANVLLNRCIAEIDPVDSVFVHPHMGDGGLATGAAFAMSMTLNSNLKPYKLQHAYLGCDFTDEQILQALKESGFAYQHYENIEKEMAKLLAEGKVVARFEGRMEYGPRALGHRSILYQPTDPSVNEWLNKRLNRSEFMPFAPVILEQDADDYFVFDGQYHAASFMTIVCKVTEKCRQLCPSVVHVDGTARPQIVNKQISPSFYNTILEYKKLTGIPVIINTSFNMHEDPIVDCPKTAIDAFSRGHLDYLAIANFLVKHL